MKILSKNFKALFLLTIITVMASCTSTAVIQDYSSQTQFTEYKTYQWLPSHTSKAKLPQDQSFTKQRIEQAIIKHLTNRGALVVRNQAEAYISYGYQLITTETIEPRTTIGLGWGVRHFGLSTQFPIDYEKNVYKDIEWSVNIYNARQKLIWQGKVTKPLKQFENPAEAEVYTQEVIDSILQKFPPK